MRFNVGVGRLKTNPLYPVLLIIVILLLFGYRWETKGMPYSNDSLGVFKTDRWTGQVWAVVIVKGELGEFPIAHTDAQRTSAVKTRQAVTFLGCVALASSVGWLGVCLLAREPETEGQKSSL